MRATAKAVWARLRGGELTPWRAAASVAVGLAIGVTPLYGLHLVLVLAVCLPLRLDVPLAYVAANVSLPFFAPFLSFAEIEFGAWVRTGRALPIDVETLRTHSARLFVGELVIGTLILSPASALAGGALTYLLVATFARRRKRRAPSPFDAAVARVAGRYARGRKAAFYYVRSKLAGDPIAHTIASMGPLGDVSDVGCGRGQLGVLLLEMGHATRAAGFDWDSEKVADATLASAGLPAIFEVGDVRTHAIPICDTALIVDVLHYLEGSEQDELLQRAASAARCKILVREIDPDRGLRSTLTRWQEWLTTSLRYNVGARVRPRSVASLHETLERAGFVVTIEPCWGKTPFANVLLVATRRGVTGDGQEMNG